MKAQRLLLGFLLSRLGHLKRTHLGRARRMILAQRVAVHVGGMQDPRQMRVAVEDDAEHVPHFALVPVRGRPEVGDRSGAQVGLR